MGKNFSFRFDTILNLKEMQEDNKKSQLGNATQKLKKEEENLFQLLNKKNNLSYQWKERTKEAITIKEVQIHASKLKYIDEVINNQSKKVLNCESTVNNCRIQLIEATKQTKIFNKLKEKDSDVFQYQLMKNEEALLDQLVSYKTAVK